MAKTRSMKMMTNCIQLLLGSLLFLSPSVSARSVNAKAAPCPTDPSIIGYTSIADINQDQYDELARITAGSSKASPPYSFVLCPNTEFDTTAQTLKIVLSGSVFSCGSETAANSELSCSLKGGAQQVYVTDSTTPNYELSSATIVGVTFENFNGTSIDVLATEKLTLTLVDVIWKNFFSDFVIRQQPPMDGASPARVDLVGGLIDNGMGGSLFSNDGGVLVLDELTVANITSAGLVSTSNGGVVMMEASKVSRCVIDTIASATMGSTLSIIDVDFFDIVFTKTVVHVSDDGSVLTMKRSKIRDISSDGKWTGIAIHDSAEAKLEQVEFKKNIKFESLLDGRNKAMVSMIDCVFDGNTGLSPMEWSSVVYAFLHSDVRMSRTKFDGNSEVQALVFAAMQSMLSIRKSCFSGGSSEEVVFRSSDSTASLEENYAALNIRSTSCPIGNARVTVEQVGSQCYQRGGVSCNTQCETLADQSLCVADMAVLAPDVLEGRNATLPNTTAPVPGATTPPVVGGNMTTPPPGPPGAGGNVTGPPPAGGNGTITPPGTDDSVVTINIGFEIANDMMITDVAEINASGLGEAFPVFVEQLVANLTSTARRQLWEQQRRRLEISLVPGSAAIYEIIPVGCVADNRTGNVTSNFSTTCHEAMGKYDLALTPDEDPAAVRSTWTQETRKAIDDGTFQQVLLEVAPGSPLVVGPSIDVRNPETEPPSGGGGVPTIPMPSGPPNTLFPTIAGMPTCGGSKSKSKSKGRSGSKGASKGKGSVVGHKKMRKHRRAPPAPTRRLDGHLQPADEQGNITPELAGEFVEATHADEMVGEEVVQTSHFENALKDHDEGDYYAVGEHDDEEEDMDVDDECEEPLEARSRSKSSKSGKGGSYRERRQLQESRPRIHGAHHKTHRISDMRAVLAAELEDVN